MWAITASCWSFNLSWSMYTFQHIPTVLLQKAWEYKGNSTRFYSPVYANLQFTEHRKCAEERLHVFKVNVQVLVYVCVCDACNSIIFLLFCGNMTKFKSQQNLQASKKSFKFWGRAHDHNFKLYFKMGSRLISVAEMQHSDQKEYKRQRSLFVLHF